MNEAMVYLGKAAQILSTGGVPFEARFLAAANEFWTAAAHPTAWPQGVYCSACTILTELLAQGAGPAFGPGERKLNEPAAREVAAEILHLANELAGKDEYLLVG
jgi:hypothetical protein